MNECYDEIRNVVLEACRANLEFRANDNNETHAEARDAILEGKLNEMMTQAFAAWLPAKNSLTASLMSNSPDAFVRQLEASLSEEVDRFSRQFLELLERMVDRELFGLVEWLPKQCCRYHFFRRVVIQGPEVRTQSINDSFADDSDAGSGQRIIGNRRTTSRRTVSHEIRFARHQHELINAVRTSIGNSTVIMPPPIVRLVDSIPRWLYPFVEVIDGQIVRELIIERDVSVEDWTQVDVRDEPIIDIDPGIVIGPYVLSGWGSMEIQKEQERRQVAQQTSNGRSRRSPRPFTCRGSRWTQRHRSLVPVSRFLGPWKLVVCGAHHTDSGRSGVAGISESCHWSSFCRPRSLRTLYGHLYGNGAAECRMVCCSNLLFDVVGNPGRSWRHLVPRFSNWSTVSIERHYLKTAVVFHRVTTMSSGSLSTLRPKFPLTPALKTTLLAWGVLMIGAFVLYSINSSKTEALHIEVNDTRKSLADLRSDQESSKPEIQKAMTDIRDESHSLTERINQLESALGEDSVDKIES